MTSTLLIRNLMGQFHLYVYCARMMFISDISLIQLPSAKPRERNQKIRHYDMKLSILFLRELRRYGGDLVMPVTYKKRGFFFNSSFH